MKILPLALTAGLALLPLASVAAEPSPEARAGYEAACARCHDVGMMGAPVTDEPADWADRKPADDAVLQHHADEGLLRGGVDDKARKGAEYMQEVTG